MEKVPKIILGGILIMGIIFILIIPVSISSMITVILGGDEEDNNSDSESEGYYVTMLLSEEVEALRDKVLAQAEKEGMEEYIELFLAVMQQESGGNGSDVFQASESKGLPPNTLGLNESITQGVKYLSAMIKKAKCTSPKDIPHIKLALQGYNFGGAYIDYAVKKDGKWTQENTFAYAKKQSKGKRNTGTRVQTLGPWHYGDQYYTQHVLRYYSLASIEGDANDAKTVPLANRMKWLFPSGTPHSELSMQPYLTQFKVPIYTKDKKKSTMTLTAHKKLVSEITAAFEDMQKAKFPIDPTCTAAYSFRPMATNASKLTYHSYGVAIDINWTHNGATYTSWPYKPGKDKFAITDKIVKIWKNHGFYWGGDWSEKFFDPMHITYVNH